MSDLERGISINVLDLDKRLPATSVNTVLVFGSRGTGVYDLAHNFQEYLEVKGLPSPCVYAVSDAELIKKAFLNVGESGNINPPRGVILLPEMRQHDPRTGSGITLNTYDCGIDMFVGRLCSEYGVPLVKIMPNTPTMSLTEGLKEIYKGE